MAQYLKEGWRPNGPGRCICPNCRATVSTNALARARHTCPQPGEAMKPKQKLVLQQNGMIVLETRTPTSVQWGPARDLKYGFEYKTTTGWRRVTEFTDDMTARQAIKEANPGITWRLVAFNETLELALPNKWQGYRA